MHHCCVEALVWVVGWQQQCCGARFRVGSSVRWSVRQHDVDNEWVSLILGSDWGQRIGFTEGHHDDEVDGVIEGMVTAISVVTCSRVSGRDPDSCSGGKVLVPKPGSGRLRSVQDADPWEPEPTEAEAGWSFEGWAVRLSGATFEEVITGPQRA